MVFFCLFTSFLYGQRLAHAGLQVGIEVGSGGRQFAFGTGEPYPGFGGKPEATLSHGDLLWDGNDGGQRGGLLCAGRGEEAAHRTD